MRFFHVIKTDRTFLLATQLRYEYFHLFHRISPRRNLAWLPRYVCSKTGVNNYQWDTNWAIISPGNDHHRLKLCDTKLSSWKCLKEMEIFLSMRKLFLRNSDQCIIQHIWIYNDSGNRGSSFHSVYSQNTVSCGEAFNAHNHTESSKL